jgi:hypothetical protein
MSLQDLIKLVEDSRIEIRFLVRLREMPPSVLHRFACDCAARLLPQLREDPEGMALYSAVTEKKRAWIEGACELGELEEARLRIRGYGALEEDARAAFWKASDTEASVVAEAPDHAAWASFDERLGEGLEAMGERLQKDRIFGLFHDPPPLSVWLQKGVKAITSPRRMIGHLARAIQRESGEVIQGFREAFTERGEERRWQRQHLLELLQSYQRQRAHLLYLLTMRIAPRLHDPRKLLSPHLASSVSSA